MSTVAPTTAMRCPKCGSGDTERGVVIGWYCRVCGWRGPRDEHPRRRWYHWFALFAFALLTLEMGAGYAVKGATSSSPFPIVTDLFIRVLGFGFVASVPLLAFRPAFGFILAVACYILSVIEMAVTFPFVFPKPTMSIISGVAVLCAVQVALAGLAIWLRPVFHPGFRRLQRQDSTPYPRQLRKAWKVAGRSRLCLQELLFVAIPFILFLVCTVVYELKTNLIPDMFVLPAAAYFLPAAAYFLIAASVFGLRPWWQYLLGAVVMLSMFTLAGVLFNDFAGGDFAPGGTIKLFATVGAALGITAALQVATVFMAVVAVAVIASSAFGVGPVPCSPFVLFSALVIYAWSYRRFWVG